MDLSNYDIIKVEKDDQMVVRPDGELITERTLTITARPRTELRYIEMQITVLPTGGTFE